ncbi:MAG: monovalent cation/H+ antiporter subunit D family protein [Geovibrio sp.]|nr:monovalent cation/H+ antiporter subunit D family protein [Geovibrio sp.]
MNLSANFPAFLVALPLIFVPVIPLLGMYSRKICWYVTVAVITASFGMIMSLLAKVSATGPISYFMGNWAPPIGIEYRIDMLNAFVLAVISFISLVSLLFGKELVEKEIPEEKHPAFYSVFILFVVGMMGITVTGDLFNVYVFLEITSLSGYALIAVSSKRYAPMASFNYLVIGTIAATFIVLGIGYLYMVTGTLNMADLAERVKPLHGSSVVLAAYAFILVGLFVKMAVFPLHLWLPDAYTYSPSAVSAAMAATSTKVGAYVLIRLIYSVFDIEFSLGSIPMTSIIIFFASLSIIAGSVIAIAQTNIKKMLAYSSVGQIGYILLAAAMVNTEALTGGMVHIFSHALMKGGLFFVVGLIVFNIGTERICDFAGLGRRMPFMAAAFTVFSLSIIGVPLTVGFVSKWYLIMGAIASGHWYAIGVVLLSSLLTAIYFGKVIFVMYFKGGHECDVHTDAHSAETKLSEPMGMVIPMAFVAFLCIYFGIFATFPVEMAAKAAEAVLGGVAWK